MPISQEHLTAIDELSQRLTSESILIQSGRDDGLIPIYSLLGELIELADADDAFLAPVHEVRNALDQLLDNALPFDDANVALVKRLIDWLPMAVLTRRAEDDLPTWDQDVLEEDFTIVGTEPAEPAPAPVQVSGLAPAPAVDRSVDTLLDLNMEENAELLAEFHAEAVDHLQQIEAALLVLDEHPKDADAMASMFRSFHTIKGVSGFLKLTPMHTLTHEVESLLDLARNDELDLTPAIITEILRSRDAVQAMVQQITVALEQGELPDEVIAVSHLIAAVKRVAVPRGSDPVAAPAPVQPNVANAPEDSAPISFAEEVADTADAAGDDSGEKEKEAKSARKSKTTRPVAATATVRVNTEKLDILMNVVGELVIVQSQLMESSRESVNTTTDDGSTLTRNLTQLGRITKELQHTAMSLRMVPVKPTFQKMERIARDLSRECGKKVSFTVSGEDTEIDRSVVEEIADPLVHMVRNAMDHGLEDPAGRIAAGKDEVGNVALHAYHQGSNMVIELTDDGRGIDAAKVLAKAKKQGLVSENHGLEENEIYQLIFHPGFSTAEKVTAVSGRGVGMDVVKRNIEKLRGKIEIESTLGKGSTFRIMLPLTMAIIDGLVVKVGEDRFILPSTSVQMALRPSKEILSKIQGTGEVLDHRGKILPITRLHQQFGIPGAIEQPTEGIMVIVEAAGRSHALLVDEMVNKQEVVIKSLGSYLQGLKGVAGGAILGDGNIALILDPGELFHEAA